MRQDRVEAQFVDFVPDALDPGVLYISIPYGAVVHSCCCGCGENVSTPLSPAQWNFTFDGEHISLSPSVGSGSLACNSHYFITRNEVRWARSLSKAETAASLRHDHEVAAEHLAPQPAPTPAAPSWWQHVGAWMRTRLHR